MGGAEVTETDLKHWYSLVFELAGLPKTPNGSFGSWRREHGERKKWRAMTHLYACQKRPAVPLKKARLVLTRFSASEPDYDNLVRTWKPVIDQLVADGILEDDKRDVIGVPVYRWERAKPKQGKVRIEVYEVEA